LKHVKRYDDFEMFFIGLDLAWGAKNTSGGCVLCYDSAGPATVVDVTEALGNDDDILAWIDQWDTGDSLLIGIDAPLLVPNETGKRPCETELGRRFAKFQAGAHPANRNIFGGNVRGERMVSRLAERHVTHDPYLKMPRQPKVRQVMEVFPHPAHVVLFGLRRTLKYKAKPGRDYPSRWAALDDYARHLRALTTHDPPLCLPDEWPRPHAEGLRGAIFKRYEDGLDALTCAYIVYWYWWHGGAGAEVIGDMNCGYIVVPSICS
jgi:predicted RNase H-like nuclease